MESPGNHVEKLSVGENHLLLLLIVKVRKALPRVFREVKLLKPPRVVHPNAQAYTPPARSKKQKDTCIKRP